MHTKFGQNWSTIYFKKSQKYNLFLSINLDPSIITSICEKSLVENVINFRQLATPFSSPCPSDHTPAPADITIVNRSCKALTQPVAIQLYQLKRMYVTYLQLRDLTPHVSSYFRLTFFIFYILQFLVIFSQKCKNSQKFTFYIYQFKT